MQQAVEHLQTVVRLNEQVKVADVCVGLPYLRLHFCKTVIFRTKLDLSWQVNSHLGQSLAIVFSFEFFLGLSQLFYSDA